MVKMTKNIKENSANFTKIYKKNQLHISVRNLVEFIFRSGDIDNRSNKLQSAEAMQEGTRIHRKIQKSMGPDYMAEVPLLYTMHEQLYDLTIEGRADGIFTESVKDTLHEDFGIVEVLAELEKENNMDIGIQADVKEKKQDDIVWVDEIKGMYRNVKLMEEPEFVHKAQAMCYAYIFAFQNELERIGVQMTYCNLESEEIKRFREIYEYENLKQWFDDLCAKYKQWADYECRAKTIRQESIKKLDFPFEYRDGQKKLVQDVYRTILRKKNLFLQAPTGVGKTISTVYPAVKAVGENLGDRIFYLTAKTITATVARETFGLLRDNGYQGNVVMITAKEKMCPCDELDCNPVNCPYAKGHYDRVNDAVFELLNSEGMFTREVLLEQAQKHQVCPFEMCLDVSTWADNIICDYNYVFDPNVYLKRFFQEGIKGDYIFLVDEAHNLVERSREMYSAVIYKEDFLLIKKMIKSYSKGIAKTLDKCNKLLLEYKRECESFEIYENLGNILFHLMRLMTQIDEFLQKPIEFPGRKDLVDFYFTISNFLNIYDLVDENYVIYSQICEDDRFMIKLFCVDPSRNLQKCIDKGNATIFFSATLLPINYYKRMLSTKKDNYAIYAHSVFKEEQSLLLFGRDVSTKYTRRNATEFEKMARYIFNTISGKKGNYMVFFPSYKLMNQVEEVFSQMLLDSQRQLDLQRHLDSQRQFDSQTNIYIRENSSLKVRTIVQTSGMNELEREEFINAFEEETDDTLVAFCVMGGIFGEGIDLKNDRLIGAIVVGTGLPQVSIERDILKNYYDKQEGDGFDYAYRYPGMNKVLQAAGRVIRTTEDKGVIVLLDERFLQSDYQYMYPREWSGRKVCDIDQVKELVSDFWQKA